MIGVHHAFLWIKSIEHSKDERCKVLVLAADIEREEIDPGRSASHVRCVQLEVSRVTRVFSTAEFVTDDRSKV
jgi:hypothetical protein